MSDLERCSNRDLGCGFQKQAGLGELGSSNVLRDHVWEQEKKI